MREYPESKKKANFPGKILVTAGPTIEPLDPVRYISNYSTGTMGYEIAAEGVRRGFDVVLISGPVCLAPPPGATVIKVKTAREMLGKVNEHIKESDGLIMTAAVCDFRPEKVKAHKIRKRGRMTLRLVKNPDILMKTGRRDKLVKIGFALETENPVESAKKKLRNKNLDLIIVNKIKTGLTPFGPGRREYTIINARGRSRNVKKSTKKQMAGIIIGEMQKLLK